MDMHNHQTSLDFFSPIMRLAINTPALEYRPAHNLALTAPVNYQVASSPRFNKPLTLLIALSHLLAFVAIVDNYQQRSDAPADVAPMIVNLINTVKNNVAAVTPQKIAPLVNKIRPVTTTEKSAVLANEKPETQAQPLPEKVLAPSQSEVSVAKKMEQKVDSVPSFEPPKFNADYLQNPAPDYPGMSRRRGEQGRVTLKVMVDATGKAEKIELEKSSGFELLDKAAMDAVRNWKFIPASNNHQSVAGTVIVPVRFSLDN